MNYAIYTYCKIKTWIFWTFRFLFLSFLQNFEKWNVRIYFGILGVICNKNWYFEYDIRILCILMYIGTYFKQNVGHFLTFFGFLIPEVWTIFVRTIFWYFWGFLVLNGPLTSLKHPQIDETMYIYTIYTLYIPYI